MLECGYEIESVVEAEAAEFVLILPLLQELSQFLLFLQELSVSFVESESGCNACFSASACAFVAAAVTGLATRCVK